ncbi:Glutamyl-tRNA(Gln) amidotransferase subunit C, chloroplastic/mitochondrial [Apostasia shenzhenica]|uniref:Glutamyl-tRNA(Gln) amidotransferase subunit C, chloroplastic/mitochondrial n=1 Tax=Apostasia shenzhenica TaxID=1088818 RepID=A0A2I0AN84_9ASPA|nr:Glutamyl-tRNA(Gln) amidotransferase subunit C, chloroplastic/mitochondrial [Apostasia shenzhenica]
MASTFSGAGASVALWCLNGRHLAVFRRRLFSETAPRCSSLQPPDVPLLADAARITLSPAESLTIISSCRDAIVAAIPSYDNPYMKVPKIINKD